jgi:hypothetical protein
VRRETVLRRQRLTDPRRTVRKNFQSHPGLLYSGHHQLDPVLVHPHRNILYPKSYGQTFSLYVFPPHDDHPQPRHRRWHDLRTNSGDDDTDVYLYDGIWRGFHQHQLGHPPRVGSGSIADAAQRHALADPRYRQPSPSPRFQGHAPQQPVSGLHLLRPLQHICVYTHKYVPEGD